jgi:hypothetical protein
MVDQGESTILLKLGPDIPSRVTLVAGIPAATGLPILVAIAFHLSAWTWPILALLWLFAVWYIVATATIAFTEVSTHGLVVHTALRHCDVVWQGVTDVSWRGGRLNLFTADDRRLAISQYSLNPMNVRFKWPKRQVSDAMRLERAIAEARQHASSQSRSAGGATPSIRLTWIGPFRWWRHLRA